MAETKKPGLRASLWLVHLLFLICGAHAASFQRNQLLRKEPDLRLESGPKLPNPEMIRALEYIEKLRQQAHREESSPDYSSYQGIAVPGEEGRAPQGSRDALSEDEWLRVILEALRQADTDPQAAVKDHQAYALGVEKNFPADLTEDYEAAQPWAERKLTQHLRFPVMYEEVSRDNPFKRTNEIVEEQYTPQSLATLESVFQELGKLTGPGGTQKRERAEDEPKAYAGDEDDLYKAGNIAYEDVVGGEDWSPMEEKSEGQAQDEARDALENTDKKEQPHEDAAKRAGQLGLPEEEPLSGDASKLVAYLKRLVSAAASGRSQAGQAGDRAARLLQKPLDAQSIYQLIEISRNLQIPPEDLIEMLKTGEKPVGLGEPEQELDLPGDLDDVSDADLDHPDLFPSKMLSKSGYPKTPSRAGAEALPDGLSVEDVLNLLEMESNAANQKPPYSPNQYSRDKGLARVNYGPGKSRANQLSKAAWMPDVENQQELYDNLNDKDQELGEYLARMLVKYPEIMNSNPVKRGPTPDSSEDDLLDEDQIEQAIKEHLGQGSSQETDKVSKRFPVGSLKNDDTPNKQYLDEDLLMKVLEYLNQEKAEKGREHVTQRAMENM
ncbi:LOW QUALITY PROTEIN: secretogranin-2 [Perognathus longimembris pacificus]|uniref:LOW QUALITY PROTEIN: secretogranin-2 n=1 Tax=Perognathus longimembris pacificus TaxID=214514 RepID=UPI00201A0F89|nr:LOW QUALITY PROTEIN: secretogranin-2 [Perognathus longimembris pacificus]